jgi:hypothetical protein
MKADLPPVSMKPTNGFDEGWILYIVAAELLNPIGRPKPRSSRFCKERGFVQEIERRSNAQVFFECRDRFKLPVGIPTWEDILQV